MALALLLGAAFAAIARVFLAEGKVGNTDPSRWSYGHFGSYVNGIGSCWMIAPGVIASCTSSQQLASLGPRVSRLRNLVVGLGFCAFVSSVVAWQHWNVVTGAFDQLLALCLLFSIYILGVLRGGWIAIVTVFFCLCTVLNVAAEESLEEYQPLPHATFRMFGVVAGQAALNGGLCVATPPKLFFVSIPMVAIWLGHIQLEWSMARCWEKQYCTYLFEPPAYMAGLARNLVAVCLFLAVAYAALRRDAHEETHGGTDKLGTIARDIENDFADTDHIMEIKVEA